MSVESKQNNLACSLMSRVGKKLRTTACEFYTRQMLTQFRMYIGTGDLCCNPSNHPMLLR